MQQTPEEKAIDEVMQRMGFITPPNVNTSFQQLAPILAEPEPEITQEQHSANQKIIAEIMRARGYRHPGDRA